MLLKYIKQIRDYEHCPRRYLCGNKEEKKESLVLEIKIAKLII